MAKRKFSHPLDKALFEAFGINYINHKSRPYVVMDKFVKEEIAKAIKDKEKECTMISNGLQSKNR